MRWLEAEQGRRFDSYADLWTWSVTELEAFWESIWRYYRVKATCPYTRVLSSRAMPGARWFEGAMLNYAERALDRTGSEPAVVWRREDGLHGVITADGLRDRVARARAGLARLGVKKGD